MASVEEVSAVDEDEDFEAFGRGAKENMDFLGAEALPLASFFFFSAPNAGPKLQNLGMFVQISSIIRKRSSITTGLLSRLPSNDEKHADT